MPTLNHVSLGTVCVFLQVDTKRWNLLDHRVGTALLDAARLPSTVAVTNHSPDAF